MENLGYLAVLLAFLLSAYAVVAALAGKLRHNPFLEVSAQRAVLGAWLMTTAASAILLHAILTDNFSFNYVASRSNADLDLLYKVAAWWGGQEGSLLFWSWIAATYSFVSVYTGRKRHRNMISYVVVTMAATQAFFLGLVAFEANPFQVIMSGPQITSVPDGSGLNPLLQHPMMAIHPPMLYLGYVGFTVPFAFALASLITRQPGERWIHTTRIWTMVTWLFQSIGILLGARWAYVVLGWGGYWGWDPVENASLLPWLTATAYLHSAMVQERRGMLRVWNLSLVCATFSLTILGTFITRSGVLDSVHSFTASGIGPAILGFFGVVAAAAVLLIGWRGDRLRAPGRFDSFFSREGTFLANNLLFALFAAVVLLGTVFPLVAEAVSGERLSVGAPYFQRMTMPLGMLLLFLMAAAPVLPWRKASTELLGRRLFWPAWCGVAVLAAAVGLGARGPAPLVAFALGGFAGGAAARQLVLAARRQGWRGLLGRTNGGMVTHIGVVVVAVALAASGSYLQQAELSLREGEAVRFAGQEFGFVGVREVVHPERLEVRAEIAVDGACCAASAISRYTLRGQVVGHPANLTSARRDVQLSVVRLPSETGGNLVLRITVQPLILWLWVGGAVMLAGAVLAAFPGRRRRPTDPVSALEVREGREPAPQEAQPAPSRADATPAGGPPP